MRVSYISNALYFSIRTMRSTCLLNYTPVYCWTHKLDDSTNYYTLTADINDGHPIAGESVANDHRTIQRNGYPFMSFP